MGKSKRKRGDPCGSASLTLLPPRETIIKAPTVVEAAVPQSTLKVDKPQLPIVKSLGLRQFTASGQAQLFSGNQAGFLKVQYLAKVAEWAATTVPNLGALLGQRLAATSEALGIEPPTSHSLCQRCETVLQVGENCSVRVTKAPKKWRKAKAKGVDSGIKNAVVYYCHFCKFGNKTPGTARGHVKTKTSLSAALSQMNKMGSEKAAIATPGPTPGTTKSKKRGKSKASAAAPKVAKNEAKQGSIPTMMLDSSKPNSVQATAGGGKKRKRKGWSTLKDMATAQLNSRVL